MEPIADIFSENYVKKKYRDEGSKEKQFSQSWWRGLTYCFAVMIAWANPSLIMFQKYEKEFIATKMIALRWHHVTQHATRTISVEESPIYGDIFLIMSNPHQEKMALHMQQVPIILSNEFTMK
jgi:hypothetical protein